MTTLVILGNRMDDDGSPTSLMLRRMEIALSVVRVYKPDNIIVCGGPANPAAGITEAHWMKRYLTDNRVTVPVICEDRSLTTEQNARFASELLKNIGTDKIYLCTTPEHMNRIYLNPRRLFRHFLKGTRIKIVPVSTVQ